MKMIKLDFRLKGTLEFTLLLLLGISIVQMVPAYAASSAPAPGIYGKVVDANNGSAIPGATVLIWDMVTLERPKPWAGMYLTDEKGWYNASGPYIVPGHVYRIYAYRGNTTTGLFDYIPQIFGEVKMGQSSVNVSFRLVPGASVYLMGKIYAVETPLQPFKFSVTVNSLAGSPYQLNAGYIFEYGETSDRWFLQLDRSLVIVPSNMPVSLQVNALFLNGTYGGKFSVTFEIEPIEGIFLPQGGRIIQDVAEYSLSRSLDVVNAYILERFHEVDQARIQGFYVADESSTLMKTQSEVLQAEEYLMSKQYDECFSLLREAYSDALGVSETLSWMRIVSSTNAVYLPAFFAVYSVILAFFIFENDKRKLISSLILYVIFLASLFWIYPGTWISVNQLFVNILGNQISFFWLMAVAFMAIVLALIFGVTRLWREPGVEGRASLTSVASVIFSMSKRQIRRRKLRGFFTITSVIILVLAFTSLTSFGTVIAVTSTDLGITSPYMGILVKRPGAEAEGGVKIHFTTMSMGDISLLSSLFNIKMVAPKLESMPTSEPIGRLEAPAGKSITLYGALGIAPTNETAYSSLQAIIENGSYLSDEGEDQILISIQAASRLGVKVGDTVTLYIRGFSGALADFTIRGLFNDAAYGQLLDLNGEAYGPRRIVAVSETIYELRPCNASDIIVLNWRTAMDLQAKADAASSTAAQFACLSRIAFQPASWEDLQGVIHTLTFDYQYYTYVSRAGRVTLYYIGLSYEVKGTAELLIPLVMVCLNVGAVMLNAVYERRRETEILSVIGLNPAHLALLFVAEGIVIGMIGGGMGYLLGLGFYRVMSFIGINLMVREKLEWWWSAIGFGLAILASVLSTIRPAMVAVRMYTPSMTRKLKLTEKEKEKRQEEIFKVYHARRWTMPIRVQENEAIFFFSYLLSRVKEIEIGTHERTEEIIEEPELETPKGELIKRISFNYTFSVYGKKRGTKNQIICTKGPREDYYRVELESSPAELETPEEWVERTVKILHDIIMDWLKDKKRIMGIP